MGGVNDKAIETQDGNLVKTASPLSPGVHSNTIEKTYQKHDDNLETFTLIWLDQQVNKTGENRILQQKLQEIINCFKTFDDQQRCKHYILSLSSQDRVVLIVNGQCGRQLVPQIHQLRQLSSIYVYCMNKQANEQWTKDFNKIRNVIVKQDDLINEIKGDHRRQLRMEEPLSFNCYTVNDNPDQSTTELNGHFIHSLLLIDVLIRMKSANSDKKALIKLCKEKYQTKKRELTQVRDFEYEYSAEKAVWWYTRESFLHKMLNEALRVQDIDLLFLFRFVIADIYEQLEQHKCRSAVRVYRGQFMSNDELDRLRRSKGEFISNNSFFSTTKNIEIARGFSEHSPSSNNLQQVLFIIDADPSVDTSKPFADIQDLSDNPHEQEVLFMIGCLFRLNDIHRDTEDGKTWKIRMKLCGDKENDLKNLFDHMKKEYGGGDGNVTPLSYADVLREMGKYVLAGKIYYRLLDLQLPPNDPSLPILYWSLGMLKKATGYYDDGIMWFLRALEIYKRKNVRDHVPIGNLYNWIGEMNRLKGQNHTALRYFNDAVVQFKTAHDENHSSMGNIYNNIAIVYREQKNYSDALQFYKKSLKIRLAHLPENHPDIASSYNNIGNVNFDLQRYDLAMQCYQTALKMYIKSCPAQHSDIGMSYQNIGCVHQIKYEWKEAMENYKKAANIYHHSLASDHPNVIQIEKDIKYVSSKLK